MTMPFKHFPLRLRALIAALVIFSPLEANATPVHDAILRNDLAAIRALISSNPALLTAEDPGSGGSPLRIAALLGNVPIIELLIESGANINATDSTGETPLHAAAGNEGYPDTKDAILFLLSHGANINATNTKNGVNPLHRVAARAKPEIVSLLISRGAAINARDSTGATPLHATIERGFRPQKAIVELLVSNGADVNAVDIVGYTILHKLALLRIGYTWAEIRRGSGSTFDDFRTSVADTIATTDYLISRGAQVNARSVDGLTPLHFAGSTDKGELVSLLIRRGADINAKDKFDRTPLKFAIDSRSVEAVSILRQSGASE